MTAAGPMRHQVRIEKRSTTQDSAGEQLLTWSAVVTRRAALERTPGAEVFAAAGRNARVPTVFRMRYESLVYAALTAAETRLVFDGKPFDIVSVVDRDGLKVDMFVATQEHVEESAS
jgi:SPP1 family predicted phage head-tail adaptor